MTEAEELELLELEEEEARAAAPHVRHGASGGWGYPDQGPINAAMTKFNEGLTKKGSDELVGLIGRNRVEPRPGQYLRLPDKSEVPAMTSEEIQTAFREGERQNQEAADQHWPKLGFVADMAGEILGDTALAGSRMVAPAYQALMGGARGYLGTNSDEAVDKAVGTGVGALVGYEFGKLPETAAMISETPVARAIAESGAGKKAGEVLMSTARWPGEALRRVASRRATSAAGLIQKDLNKLPPGAAEEIGGELLDRGIMKAGRTAEELRPGILEAKSETGKAIGDTHAAADALSGGSGAEVRREVAARRAKDVNALEDWAAAEGMHVDAAQTRAAEYMAERRALVEAEKNRLLSNALVTGKGREKLAQDLAEHEAALRFGDRGTTEAFERAGTVPFDLKTQAPRAATPQELTRGLGFDAHGFAEAVEGRLLPQLDDPLLKPLKTQIQTLLAGYRAKAARGMSHAEANAWKTNIQKTISKFQDAPVSQEVKIKLQAILDDEIERGIGSKLGTDALPGYRAAKNSYGLLKEAAKGNRTAIARADGNNGWGMTEMLAMGAGGTAGAAQHGSIGALLGMAGLSAGAHLLKHRGASTAAVAASSLGKLALGAVEAAPQLFGEFGAVIAGQKTPEARAAMTQELAIRYPQFAEMLEAFRGDDKEASAPRPTDRLRHVRSVH